MRTLLDYLPEVAKHVQYRFKSTLGTMLLESDRQMKDDEFLILVEYGNHYISHDITESLFTVISCVREYGKDCQVIRLKNGKAYVL